jgi:hypothetical protein
MSAFTGTWRGFRLTFPIHAEFKSCHCLKRSPWFLLVHASAMSTRSEVVWSEWEEKNLLSWLDAHRALSWKARSDAYYEQYQVDRSVESLRGKMYHILRKQRRTRARSPKLSGNRNRAGTVRRSVGRRASLATLPNKRPAQNNIEKWVQTILTAEPSHIDSIESIKTTGWRRGMS